MSQILLTGGAGYIGSITAKLLLKKGFFVAVVDNLSRGNLAAIKVLKNIGGKNFVFYKADLKDKKTLSNIFEKHQFSAVLHFAGFIEAGESMKYPQRFWRNNVDNGLNLLEAMHKAQVKKIIFSSTAAVYQSPKNNLLIKENNKLKPANVYGCTKLKFEEILAKYEKRFGFKSIILRYFNAAGADFSSLLGELHNPETHLIPRVIETALGKRKQIEVFGTDYKTIDGTCIRDYIHVNDLAMAHILALKHLLKNGQSNIYNLGNGNGYSVKEVIETVKKVVGKDFKVVENPRRKGDASFLVADSGKIKKELGWKPKYVKIEEIVKSAFDFYRGFKV